MKFIRVIVTLAPYVALVLLMACSPNGVPTVEMADPTPGTSQGCGPSNNWCAPKNDARVHDVVTQMESTGLRCSPKPRLTDHIVFQHRGSLNAEVVTYERAAALAAENAGWLRAFCISPN